MPIAIGHLTEEEFFQRGRRLNSKRLLTESRKKLKYAKDRKGALPPIVRDADFEAIEEQRTLVKNLKQQRKITARGSLALTGAQEAKLEALLKLNTRLMDLVDLSIRMKLLKGDSYRRGETPGRIVKNWEDLAEERLQQAKSDKATLMQVGLTDELLASYEKAIEELTKTDDEQESKKPAPGQAVKALAIARGKLAYMLIWLCGIAEHALHDKPEEARLFQVTDLLRERQSTTPEAAEPNNDLEFDEGDVEEESTLPYDDDEEIKE